MIVSKIFKTRDEVIDALVKDFGCKAASFNNNERTKSREKFWTYNRLRNYYYNKLRRVEQVLPNLPQKDGMYIVESYITDSDCQTWYEENDPELWQLIDKEYHWFHKALNLEHWHTT